jgi:methylmalonyl-CoA/ethylmalonyl-CoA epimerase
MYEPLFGPIKQWGFLVKNLDEAMRSWVEQLGVGPWWGYRNVTLQSQFRGETTEVKMNVGLAYQNGVQIELIEQTNRVQSPYRAFYDTPHFQMLHQLAYIVPDLDAAVQRGKAAGLVEHGAVSNAYSRYVYMDSPALAGLVVELMPHNPDFVADYARCLQEAAQWDGTNPYRLVSF